MICMGEPDHFSLKPAHICISIYLMSHELYHSSTRNTCTCDNILSFEFADLNQTSVCDWENEGQCTICSSNTAVGTKMMKARYRFSRHSYRLTIRLLLVHIRPKIPTFRFLSKSAHMCISVCMWGCKHYWRILRWKVIIVVWGINLVLVHSTHFCKLLSQWNKCFISLCYSLEPVEHCTTLSARDHSDFTQIRKTNLSSRTLFSFWITICMTLTLFCKFALSPPSLHISNLGFTLPF